MTDGLSASLRDAVNVPSAFTKVYEAMARDLLIFLLRRSFDVEVARDLTAETFAQAFEHRGRYRGATNAEAAAWLFAIARHQLSRWARNGVAHQKAVERLGIEMPAVSDTEYDRIIELAGLATLRQTVANAFSDLPGEQRDVLQLRIVDENAYCEVAAALGVSEQTARARVSRALHNIADLLEKQQPAEVNL